MNYTTLKARIEDTLEVGFTDEIFSVFTENAEKAIYNAVTVPTQRLSSLGNTASGVRSLSVPTGFIWADSLAVNDGTGERTYLVPKDYNFLREAYPNDTVTGFPKYYALLDENEILLGPVPDSVYEVQLTYGAYPETIVTAGTTWLGDNFGEVLFNAVTVEAARFNKLEQDVVKFYTDLYALSLTSMKNVLEGKRTSDNYRNGQITSPVR